MKIIADTNILVRFFVRDDQAQFEQAKRILDQAEVVVITQLALCELSWVLRSRYGVSRENISTTIALLRDSANVVLDGGAYEAGLAMLAGGADFADGVIDYEGRWLGGDTYVSFDNKAVTAVRQRGLPAKLLG